MLTLPIKKKWFDMIRSGVKKEEYREIKPYYTTRIVNELRKSLEPEGQFLVCLRNGYTLKSPELIARCCVAEGPGREEWGAVPGVRYYRLHIIEIIYARP